MGPAIDIAVEHAAWADALGTGIEALVTRGVAAALAAAGPRGTVAPGTELSVLLCDDAVMHELNRRWRGVDRATNVLSFPAGDAMRAHALGDIVVAFETSAGEAAARGMALADYLTHLVVHGTFHLIGYDHEDDAEAAEMEGLESRTLAGLGIASPFTDEDGTVHREAS